MKKRIQISILTAGFFMLFLIAIKDMGMLLPEEDYVGRLILGRYRAFPVVVYIVLTVLICLGILFPADNISPEGLKKTIWILTSCMMPAVMYFAFELTGQNLQYIFLRGWGSSILNIILYVLLYAAVFFLTGRVRFTMLFLNITLYILAAANYFVIQFRERPIMIMDLTSLSTAATVAKEYSYFPTVEMILGGMLMLLSCLWFARVHMTVKKYSVRAAGMILCIFLGSQSVSWMTDPNTKNQFQLYGIDFFKLQMGYREDGFLLGTVETIPYLSPDIPEGYDAEEAEVQLAAYDVKPAGDAAEQMPENLIVIMNESFSDLTTLGDIRMSQPVTPFMDSLNQNAEKGNLLVSTYGGGTANTEFEFLTGNSMSFIPQGSVAYQMYVKKGAASMVSLLKDVGYRTVAFHPFIKTNYNRKNVYESYGFDSYLAKEDMESFKKVRKYVSDECDFEYLIKLCEEKQEGEKLFIFNVTIQNHSGYTSKKYKSSIALTDYPDRFPESEQYLSLIHETDAAFQKLIEYFSQKDEKTVILMFGDHQPRLEDEFYTAVQGPLTNENWFSMAQQRNMTQYVAWANYDIDWNIGAYTSPNFLGSQLMKNIGLNEEMLPAYNQFGLEMNAIFPAMNTLGYCDLEGNLYGVDAENENIRKYSRLQYYHMFEKKKVDKKWIKNSRYR